MNNKVKMEICMSRKMFFKTVMDAIDACMIHGCPEDRTHFMKNINAYLRTIIDGPNNTEQSYDTHDRQLIRTEL